MKSFVVALLACMAVIFPAIVAELEIADRRYFRVYTGYDFTGLVCEFSDSVPNLNVYGVGRYMQSFCLTGQWKLFNEINYAGTNEDNNYVGVNLCRNLNPMNMVYVDSIRYSGSLYGINDVYYNLYEDTFFRGSEFKGNTDASSLGDLDLAVSSLSISGQSPWTFFTGLDYTGVGMCVLPTNTTTGENGVVINFREIPNMIGATLPDNTIRSVARGCLSERILQ